MSVLAAAFIAQLAATPACTVPGMVDVFWPAVVKTESHHDPNALKDDTTGRSYYPATAEAAEVIAGSLMQQGHSVGVGLSQLTARSERQFADKFGLTVRQALDPCTNMKTGARFYVDRALGLYNGDRSGAYARTVMARVTAAPRSAIESPPADDVSINDVPAEAQAEMSFR